MAAVSASELDNRKPRAAGLERRDVDVDNSGSVFPSPSRSERSGDIPYRTMNEAEPGL